MDRLWFRREFTILDKRGQWLEMWNYDAHDVNSERAYENVPFFISSRGYGMLVDSTTPVRFDMAASNHATFSVIAPEDALEYCVIAGADPLEIVRRYGDSPLLEWSISRVNVNGVALERRERVSLEAYAPAGWAAEADGTLVALLRRAHSR